MIDCLFITSDVLILHSTQVLIASHQSHETRDECECWSVSTGGTSAACSSLCSIVGAVTSAHKQLQWPSSGQENTRKAVGALCHHMKNLAQNSFSQACACLTLSPLSYRFVIGKLVGQYWQPNNADWYSKSCVSAAHVALRKYTFYICPFIDGDGISGMAHSSSEVSKG